MTTKTSENMLLALDDHHRDLYDSGYGDFAFAKSLEEVVLYTQQHYLDQDINVDSGFERSGTFPFYQLPAEVRSKILDEVRRPLLKIYRDTNTQQLMQREGMQIVIKDNIFYTTGNVGAQFIMDRRRAQGFIMETCRLGYPQEEHHMYHQFRGFEDQYSEVREVAKPAATPHPFRVGASNHTIELRAQSYENESELLVWRAYVDWIRKALNVSRAFRKDLEEFLWRDVELYVLDQEFLPGFVDFLRGRPAIHQTLKKVDLRFHRKFESVEDIEGIGNCLTYLAENIKVEELVISIEGNEQDLENLAMGEGDQAYLKLIKNIPVTKCFEVVLRNIFFDAHNFAHDVDGEKKYKVELEKRVMPRIKELLIPRSFDESEEPRNEIDCYLATRAQIMSIE